ncbi:hypothetical protein TNCV_2393771 [Trichonephila clavipes]|nr:hypothetical protein TNCV_2393771 [Trichonephila clavipes]
MRTLLSTRIIPELKGRGSRVVWVSDRGLPCHEFEPSTTKDPPSKGKNQHKEMKMSLWKGSEPSGEKVSATLYRPSLGSIVRHRGEFGLARQWTGWDNFLDSGGNATTAKY